MTHNYNFLKTSRMDEKVTHNYNFLNQLTIVELELENKWVEEALALISNFNPYDNITLIEGMLKDRLDLLQYKAAIRNCLEAMAEQREADYAGH